MKRAYRRRPPHWLTILLVLLLLAGGRIAQRLSQAPSAKTRPPASLDEGRYQLIRVVDGDTILVRSLGGADRGNAPARVRLVGIDTPEIFDHGPDGATLSDNPEPFGPEAAEFTREFLSGETLTLRFGPRRVDQYDRFLAYVFVGDEMLNEELVRTGLARVEIYPGEESSLSSQLIKAEREARDAQRGIWSGNSR